MDQYSVSCLTLAQRVGRSEGVGGFSVNIFLFFFVIGPDVNREVAAEHGGGGSPDQCSVHVKVSGDNLLRIGILDFAPYVQPVARGEGQRAGGAAEVCHYGAARGAVAAAVGKARAHGDVHRPGLSGGGLLHGGFRGLLRQVVVARTRNHGGCQCCCYRQQDGYACQSFHLTSPPLHMLR